MVFVLVKFLKISVGVKRNRNKAWGIGIISVSEG